MTKSFNKYKSYENKINDIVKKIENADAIVIGIGAGMTASGGISYMDQKIVKELFPEYANLGFKSIVEIQSAFWRLSEENKLSYWGYWARHIDRIRYKTKLLAPYKNLVEIISNKNYFICTTNADGQTQKSGFNKDKIFAPQGNYDVFQCIVPCSRDEVYFNENMIKNMVDSINEKNQIDEKFIPKCPKCGNYLIPNLRCDDKFVEKPHMYNLDKYRDFIMSNMNKNIVFLELGVGFNTPGIIRFPFEQLTDSSPNATLIRINKGMATVPKEIESKSICIDDDINEVLIQILKMI
ncbi:NAD-dependent protein deacetylase, SIR2 family [Paraclostridium sordellii]|uniref:NAD-dependent protein deacetylase n=1 Tax=Paraclostridium sordellii TaxID=1505 RepID=A0A9P1P9T3_PARSO|nr:NAD-dependent protein deacetylase, SIR2 family [Paeniclostridium sordellii]CEO32672.1 NAD-dependent protein deacetylase [[Clostridium] sordellii] [Paeniclostridium sordellii]